MQRRSRNRTLGKRILDWVTLACFAAALALAGRGSTAADAAGGEANARDAIETWAVMDAAEVAAFARAFQAAVRAHDGDGLVSLFRADATIREKNAVVAAGSAAVAEWVQSCVARRFALDPASSRLTARGATWVFSDSSGCYERTRRGGLGVSPDLGPAGGVVELALRGRQIEALIFTYNPEWEARRLASLAAPVLAAREAQARLATTPAPLATPLPLDEPPMATPPTAPPNTQDRKTPPPATWLAGAFLTTIAAALASFKRPSAAP